MSRHRWYIRLADLLKLESHVLLHCHLEIHARNLISTFVREQGFHLVFLAIL
jgi:hypothetical protein